MSKSHRIAALVMTVVALVVSPLCVSGEGTKEKAAASAEEIRIRVSSHWWQATGPMEWLNDMKTAFETKYPNIKIDPVATPWAQLTDMELMSLASPNPIDVVYSYSGNFGQFAATGMLEPLDSYLAKTDILERFQPVSFKYAKDKEGRILAVPTETSSTVFYNRKDLLANAGLAIPTTLEQVYSNAQKLTKDGVYGIAPETSGGAITYDRTWTLIRGYGGDYSENGVPTLNSQPVIKALKFVKNAMKEGLCPIGTDFTELREAWGAGKIAQRWDVSYLMAMTEQRYPEMAKNTELSLMPTPGHVGGSLVAAFFSIAKNSQHKDAAWKYLDFMCSEEWSRKFVEYYTLNATGIIPPDVNKKYPWMAVVAEQVKYAAPAVPPGLEEWTVGFKTEVTPLIVEALTSPKSVEEVMEKAQQHMVAWVAEQKKR